MDTAAVHSEMETVARLIRANVEECLKDDIDTVLRRKQENLNVLVRQAEDKFRKLISLVYKGKNKWRTDAWSIIMAHLKDEREFVLESMDTSAVCTYALYVEAAFLYLRRRADREKVVGLNLLVREDAGNVHTYLCSDGVQDVPEQDQKFMAVAMITAAFYVDRLLLECPGT